MSKYHPLGDTLAVAVPLRIAEMTARGGPSEEDWERAKAFSQTLAEKGDVLLFGGKNGEAATLFNELARAVTVMAFLPGGVRIFGGHYAAAQAQPGGAERGVMPADDTSEG